MTYWVYDPGSGLLLGKGYADDTGVAYDYTSEGRVLYRYWMRGFDVSEPVCVAGRVESSQWWAG